MYGGELHFVLLTFIYVKIVRSLPFNKIPSRRKRGRESMLIGALIRYEGRDWRIVKSLCIHKPTYDTRNDEVRERRNMVLFNLARMRNKVEQYRIGFGNNIGFSRDESSKNNEYGTLIKPVFPEYVPTNPVFAENKYNEPSYNSEGFGGGVWLKPKNRFP
jgi:hypothetical protein